MAIVQPGGLFLPGFLTLEEALMKTGTIELWVCVDENGDYAVGKDRDQSQENYAGEIGDDSAGRRYITVLLTVPLPNPIEVAGTVEISETPAQLAIKVA